MYRIIFLCLFSIQIALGNVLVKNVLVLEYSQDKTEKFVLTDKPVLSFTNGLLLINSENIEFECPLSEVKYYYFEKNDNEDIIVTKEDKTFIFEYSQGIITVHGVDYISVIDLNGLKVKEARGINTITCDVREIPSGVYIVNMQSKLNGCKSMKLKI